MSGQMEPDGFESPAHNDRDSKAYLFWAVVLMVLTLIAVILLAIAEAWTAPYEAW